MKLSIEDKNIKENQTNLLLKLIVQSEDDIKNGNIISQEEMFSSLEKKLFRENKK